MIRAYKYGSLLLKCRGPAMLLMDGVTVNTTDPNGFSYTSTWEYIDRSNPAIAAYATPDVLIDSNKLYVGFIAGMFGDYKNGNGHYNTAAGGTYGNFKVSKFSKLFQAK